MATCPNCKKSVGDAKFCPECGTKIPKDTMVYCPNCKTAVGNAKFCPECGTKIPKDPDADLDAKIDAFFDALENASQEEKDAFFGQLEKDLKKKK